MQFKKRDIYLIVATGTLMVIALCIAVYYSFFDDESAKKHNGKQKRVTDNKRKAKNNDNARVSAHHAPATKNTTNAPNAFNNMKSTPATRHTSIDVKQNSKPVASEKIGMARSLRSVDLSGKPQKIGALKFYNSCSAASYRKVSDLYDSKDTKLPCRIKYNTHIQALAECLLIYEPIFEWMNDNEDVLSDFHKAILKYYKAAAGNKGSTQILLNDVINDIDKTMHIEGAIKHKNNELTFFDYFDHFMQIFANTVVTGNVIHTNLIFPEMTYGTFSSYKYNKLVKITPILETTFDASINSFYDLLNSASTNTYRHLQEREKGKLYHYPVWFGKYLTLKVSAGQTKDGKLYMPGDETYAKVFPAIINGLGHKTYHLRIIVTEKVSTERLLCHGRTTSFHFEKIAGTKPLIDDDIIIQMKGLDLLLSYETCDQ